MEIIVVDNASSDGTTEAVRMHFPNVTLIENSANVGFARGNDGAEFAAGKYICLINPDVIVLDQCIARMREYMEGKPDIGMLGPAILDANGAVQQSCMRRPTLWNRFCAGHLRQSITSSSFGALSMKVAGFDDADSRSRHHQWLFLDGPTGRFERRRRSRRTILDVR